MVKLATYLNMIVPIVAERKRLLFDKYKLEHTKSVKADNTVRQASRANATNRIKISIWKFGYVLQYCLLYLYIVSFDSLLAFKL